MALRPCLGYGTPCPNLTPTTRCPTCEAKREAGRNRPTAHQRGYTPEYQRERAVVLARSRVCWICGHDGADQTDHVTPVSRGGSAKRTNLRPAHGTEPCPTCGVRCNQARGDSTSPSQAGRRHPDTGGAPPTRENRT